MAAMKTEDLTEMTKALVKFYHACDQVLLLEMSLKQLYARFDRNRDRSSLLYQRIKIAKGVQHMHIQYANKMAEKLRQMQWEMSLHLDHEEPDTEVVRE